MSTDGVVRYQIQFSQSGTSKTGNNSPKVLCLLVTVNYALWNCDRFVCFSFFGYHLVFVSRFGYSPGIQLKKYKDQFLYPVVCFSGPPGYITSPISTVPCVLKTLVLMLSELSEIVKNIKSVWSDCVSSEIVLVEYLSTIYPIHLWKNDFYQPARPHTKQPWSIHTSM